MRLRVRIFVYIFFFEEREAVLPVILLTPKKNYILEGLGTPWQYPVSNVDISVRLVSHLTQNQTVIAKKEEMRGYKGPPLNILYLANTKKKH